MRTILASALAACLFVLTSTAVRAEGDPKALLKEGNDLFNQGDYPAALEKYEEGYKLSPRPVFLRSMGYSLLKMMQHEKAIELFRQYLRKFPKAPDRGKIRNMIKGLDEVVETRLVVETEPPGADVYLDTEAGGRVGTTERPFRATVVPGEHLVILKAPGYATTVQKVTVPRREEKKVKVALEVPFKVVSTPAGASVHIGSAEAPPLGTTPLDGGIRPGEHEIVVALEGYEQVRRTIQAAPGADNALSVELGVSLEVTTTPPGASVLLDGNEIKGTTPLKLSGAPGEHVVTARLAGFDEATARVTLEAGKGALVNLTLRGSWLSMRTSVAGAKVRVGGVAPGVTPLTRSPVPRGQQTVRVDHPGRRAWVGRIDFREGEELRAELRMARPLWPVWVSMAVAVAGITAGSVTGVLAKNKRDAASAGGQYLCDGGGDPYGQGTSADCGYAYHHASTASFVTGGVAAAVGLAYYLIWGRHSVTITRVKQRTASATP